ncbi:type II secretion system minor pseudopilin GspK [Hirschia litorea]|uniref:Type II secretion system protein K n=2 Tax=Hirschia litorea TaxID=1199156 RepID=A0ABW2IH39_9PROT
MFQAIIHKIFDRNKASRKSKDAEHGAALITALLIVSVMSVTALSVIESLRFSMKLSGNMAQREQARLYALGAEQLAIATINAARKLSPQGEEKRYPALDEWTRTPLLFPIDGGSIKGKVEDGSNCFNLNAVVRLGEGERVIVADGENIKRLARLFEYTGVSLGESVGLANSIADWIDTNNTPEYGGAEDPDYSIQQPPYRTSATLLADVSELKVIKGFTPEMVDKMAPWLCARPNMKLSPLNINTLTLEDLPLFLTYLGPSFSDTTVNAILGERPVTGFQNVDDMWALSVFENDKIEDEDKHLFGLKSEYFDVIAQISYYQTVISLHSTLQITNSGDITNISRRYGNF